MLNKKWKYFIICGLAVLFLARIAGCAKKQNIPNETLNKETEDGIVFSIKDYKEKISNERLVISEYTKNYQKDIYEVQHTNYQNMDFTDCQFESFPEVNQINLLAGLNHGITAKESFETIEEWLTNIGKKSQIDMKKDVFVVSAKFGTDTNGNYYTLYDHIKELDEMNADVGAFISNNVCHIQLAANGIYSMSDGKMTKYLGMKERAARDVFGYYTEDVKKSGNVEKLGNKKYKLIDTKMTVRKGAQMVKSYFEKGTPFPCTKGVTVDVPQVNVFCLGNVYGYDYIVRRCYNSVPFVCTGYGENIYFHDGNIIDGDNKHAYVVDSDGVSAFIGYNEAEKLVVLDTESKILGFKQSIEQMSQKLAANLKVKAEYAGLVYVPVQFENSTKPEERIIFPCWQVEGTNQTKNEQIKIYADVLTGDIYYYTYIE